MIHRILLLATGLVIGSAASAQEYGFLAGVHQTTASPLDAAGTTTEGKFNFKLGLTMGFELADQFRFRTGAIYNQRHFDWKNTTTDVNAKVNFEYIDVPANVQYNFNEMFGVFGGLVVGINIGDKISYPAGTTTTDPGVNGLIPLADVGFNFLFADMVGFDLYYERGLGKVADHLKDYSTYGANFIYWF